jgi:guanylate kinase
MIIVIFGPGGVGKGTLVARLMEGDDRLWLSRSWTTRPRRPGEPADAYNFVDRAAFEARVAAGGFLEWAEFLGHLYGTPTPDPPAGQDVVLEIDLQGAEQVHARYPEAVIVLIQPPSRAVQEERLRKRGDPDDQIAKRLALAEHEEERGRQIAHHVVVNDDLERAVNEVAGILAQHRDFPEGTA